jgi:hypothetical protein
MGGANGSREGAPDDKLRDTHHVSMYTQQGDGFRKGSTHPTDCGRKFLIQFSNSHVHQLRDRHCERSDLSAVARIAKAEAIQLWRREKRKLDCFVAALLAMTSK